MKSALSRGLRKCCLSVGMRLVRLIGYQFCGRRDSAPLRCTMPRYSAITSLPHAGSLNHHSDSKLHSPCQRQFEDLRPVASSGLSMLGPDLALARINNDDALYRPAHFTTPITTNHHIPKPYKHHRGRLRPESGSRRPVSSGYSSIPPSFNA